MSEIDNIPMLPSGEELEAKQLSEEETLALNWLSSLEIYAADKYDKPEFTLYKNGIGFAPLGNIMAICAQMKMGKSWLMQQLACAVLKGEYMGLQCDMENTSVLYFDTEQDKYDSQMVMRRIQFINGWSFEIDNPRLHIFSMRDIPEVEGETETIVQKRMKAIKFAIQYYRPTVVFIDGVRDLVEDFNDLSESARLVQWMMSITSRYRCCIWSVLHVNPNSDKMRGHLGTELGNKTTDVFSVHKNKDAVTGEVTFEVKQVAARHRDIDDWLFRINDNAKIAVPELVDGTFERKRELDVIFHKAFKEQGNKGMSYSEMFDLIHNVEKKRGTTIQAYIRDGINLGFILESAGKYVWIKRD